MPFANPYFFFVGNKGLVLTFLSHQERLPSGPSPACFLFPSVVTLSSSWSEKLKHNVFPAPCEPFPQNTAYNLHKFLQTSQIC